MAWFRPGADPTRPWQMHPISILGTSEHPVPGTRRFSHGLGVGDVNGDGRRDVICTGGWWEQPVSAEANADGTAWKFHAARLGERCANMYTVDMNVDGKVDVVSSSAHDYGIWWHEQKTTVTGESVLLRGSFTTHLVSGWISRLPTSTETVCLTWLRATRKGCSSLSRREAMEVRVEPNDCSAEVLHEIFFGGFFRHHGAGCVP